MKTKFTGTIKIVLLWFLLCVDGARRPLFAYNGGRLVGNSSAARFPGTGGACAIADLQERLRVRELEALHDPDPDPNS